MKQCCQFFGFWAGLSSKASLAPAGFLRRWRPCRNVGRVEKEKKKVRRHHGVLVLLSRHSLLRWYISVPHGSHHWNSVTITRVQGGFCDTLNFYLRTYYYQLFSPTSSRTPNLLASSNKMVPRFMAIYIYLSTIFFYEGRNGVNSLV